MSRSSPGDEGVAVYTNGVARPDTTKAGYNLVPGLIPGRFHGYNSRESSWELTTIGVDAKGAYPLGSVEGVMRGSFGIIGVNGLLVSTSGSITDPESRRSIGSLPGVGPNASLCADAERCLVFQVRAQRGDPELEAFDLRTTGKLWSVPIVGGAGPLKSNPRNLSYSSNNLIRWGDDGIAYITDGAVVLLRVPLPPKVAPVDLSVSRTPIPRPNQKPVAYTLTVTNKGTTTASRVFLTDLMPNGAGVIDVKASQGEATAADGLLRAEIGSLAPGASATVNVRLSLAVSRPGFRIAFLKPPPGDFGLFTAVVRGPEPDPDTANNIAVEDVTRFIP